MQGSVQVERAHASGEPPPPPPRAGEAALGGGGLGRLELRAHQVCLRAGKRTGLCRTYRPAMGCRLLQGRATSPDQLAQAKVHSQRGPDSISYTETQASRAFTQTRQLISGFKKPPPQVQWRPILSFLLLSYTMKNMLKFDKDEFEILIFRLRNLYGAPGWLCC